MKKELLHRSGIIVSALLLLSGLFGCSDARQSTVDDIVLIHTAYDGTARDPVYSFALRKEDGNWLFSASCYVGDQNEHYTSFSSFRIPSEDAEGFLELVREEGEIKRLRKCREPIRHVSDAPVRSSGMTFADGSSIEKEAALSERVLDGLYALANRHYEAAEQTEIRAVFVRSSCMDPSASHSFMLEKAGNDWFFSFHAVIDRSDTYTVMEKQRIEESDAAEILRIIQEQPLAASVREYDAPPDDGMFAPEETTHRMSFGFADGSSISAPIDAGSARIDAFHPLAAAKIHQR